MTDLEVFIVPHTHWDREWYLPLEGYRHRLSLLMDRVLGLLSDGTLPCFVLDGQTVAIDDWLERHPERRDELAAHVRAGRLAIGPWFVLADELLVSGEALIRNLSEGMRLARSLGACSQVAYSPDPFGHVSQLPQIVRSFGMDTVMFARGLGDEPSTTACLWQGPDGSRVRAAILTTSYSNGRLLTHEPDISVRIAAEVERLRPHLAAPVALICTGSDHEIVDVRLAPGVAEAASRLAPWRVRFGTYDDYVAALSRCVDARNGEGPGAPSGGARGEQGPALVGELRGARTPVLVGELRGARLLPLLPGVMSAHIPIKQANERCLDLLESVAEPLSALSHALGGPDPSRLLRAAWRELLLNHAHDSICGCSVDPVHRENKVRFERVEQMASAVADEAMGYLCGQVTRVGDEGEHRVAINPLPVARTAMVAVTVRESLRPDDVGDGPMENSAAAMRRALASLRKTVGASVWTATANDGCARRVQVLEETLGEGEFPFLSAQPMRTTRLLVECTLPGFGLEAFRLERMRGPEGQSWLGEDGGRVGAVGGPGGEDEVRACAVGGPGGEDEVRACAVGGLPILENGVLRVEGMADGTLALTHLASGRVWSGLGLLESQDDAGDTYNFGPSRDGHVVTGLTERPDITVTRWGPLEAAFTISGKMRLPQGLTSDRLRRSRKTVSCAVEIEVVLRAGADRFELRVTVDNRARDHRLRVRFPLRVEPVASWGESAFDLVRRPVTVPGGEGWIEDPTTTHPQRGVVYVPEGEQGDGGLAVLARGLPEYEVVTGSGERPAHLALTLLRCVGWLSRADVPARRCQAGPKIATPDAQCLGTHHFTLAIAPLAQPCGAAELFAMSRDFAVPFASVDPNPAVPWGQESWPRPRAERAASGIAAEGLLSLDGDPIVLSALRVCDLSALAGCDAALPVGSEAQAGASALSGGTGSQPGVAALLVGSEAQPGGSGAEMSRVAMLVRCFNPSDVWATSCLRLSASLGEGWCVSPCDVDGNVNGAAIAVTDCGWPFTLAPHAICTLRLERGADSGRVSRG